jgi:N-methylhydantoinase B
MRPVEVICPEGLICRAVPPAPVSGGHGETGFKVVDTALEVLADALGHSPTLSHRAFAHWANCYPISQFNGLDQYGNYTIFFQADGGSNGGGAMSKTDGFPIAGCICQRGLTLTDVEITEENWPVLYLFKRFRKNSGGPGRFRGGVSMEIAWVLNDTEEMEGGGSQSNREISGFGLFGGYPGSTNWFVTKKNTDIHQWIEAKKEIPQELRDLKGIEEYQPAKFPAVEPFVLKSGDVFYMNTMGGGGFGDPLDRDPLMVERDVRDGYVSLQQAFDGYGVVIDAKTLEFDLAETNKKREDLRRERLRRATVVNRH